MNSGKATHISIKDAFIIHAINFFIPEEITIFLNGKAKATVEFTSVTAGNYIAKRYFNGVLVEKCSFINNKRHGAYLEFSNDGVMVKNSEYVNGKFLKHNTEWSNDGSISNKIKFN